MLSLFGTGLKNTANRMSIRTLLEEKLYNYQYNNRGEEANGIVMHPKDADSLINEFFTSNQIIALQELRYKDIPVYRSEDIIEGQIKLIKE